jgi:hypothetical protein
MMARIAFLSALSLAAFGGPWLMASEEEHLAWQEVKSHAVPKEMLEKLAEYPLSSLATTHEAGYERLGGHTVHFKLKRVDFTTRVPRESTVTLSVSKGRGITLSGPSQKPLAAAN